MEPLLNALPWAAGGLMLLLALALLRRPLGWLVRLAARTGAGLGVLWALRAAGGFLGLQLGVNLASRGTLRRARPFLEKMGGKRQRIYNCVDLCSQFFKIRIVK